MRAFALSFALLSSLVLGFKPQKDKPCEGKCACAEKAWSCNSRCGHDEACHQKCDEDKQECLAKVPAKE